MIQVTVADIVNANTGLNKLASTSFTGKQAFLIARMLKQIEDEYSIFNKTRLELINKYAEQQDGQVVTDNNGNVRIKPEYQAKFNEEVGGLLNAEITMNCDPIPSEWLDNITMTPNELQGLINFITL